MISLDEGKQQQKAENSTETRPILLFVFFFHHPPRVDSPSRLFLSLSRSDVVSSVETMVEKKKKSGMIS